MAAPYEILNRVKANIAPGASGWDATTEEASLRELIRTATEQVYPDMPFEMCCYWNTVLLDAILNESNISGTNERDREKALTAGQLNSSLNALLSIYPSDEE